MIAAIGVTLYPVGLCGGASRAPRGPLRLGVIDTEAVVHLPALLARYHRDHAETDLQLSIGTSGELVERVLDYAVEGYSLVARWTILTLLQKKCCAKRWW
ncbi:MAG: LysR substrate-binding domain-containing protein [Pedobacter sp.]